VGRGLGETVMNRLRRPKKDVDGKRLTSSLWNEYRSSNGGISDLLGYNADDKCETEQMWGICESLKGSLLFRARMRTVSSSNNFNYSAIKH